MSPKALKVVIELEIHAVTCPGVFLPEKDDVYVSVCIFGQYRKSGCLPPVFPLLFHEKMRFEKVFSSAVDPAAVAELLENETAKCELIQLIPPAGETLALYEENTRDFLFPEPKLTPAYPGVDRDVLMTRLPSFPGIAPKLEFSSRTTIKECSVKQGSWMHEGLSRKLNGIVQKGSKHRSPKKPRTPPVKTTMKKKDKGYEKPTKSRLRSPSPRTRRRLNELSENSLQQIRRLNLGPCECNSELETRPPFVIRHVDRSKAVDTHTLPKSPSPIFKRRSRPRSVPPKSQLNQDTYFASSRPKSALAKVYTNSHTLSTSEDDSLSDDDDDLVDYSLSSSTQHSAVLPFSPTTLLRRSSSPLPGYSLLQPRFLSNSHSNWESINERVQSLLTTQRAKQRLSLGATESEIEDVLERRSISPRSSSRSGSMERKNY